MPDDTGCYVEDIYITVSWWSIEEFVNDLLFMQFDNTFRIATITPGNYTTAELGTEIARAINDGYSAPRFATEFRKSQGAIIIKWADSYMLNDQVKSFKVFTISEVIARGASASRIKRSINDMLKNFTSNMNYAKSQPFISGPVDMNPVRNAYLTCTGLGNFNTMSLTGDRNIIKKISITGQPGDIIFDSSQTRVDYLGCSRQTLSRISFQLRDNFGRILDARGIHWSFPLVFSRVQNGI